MRVEHVASAAELRALAPGGASVRRDVEAIVEDVRARGDAALADYAVRFDRVARDATEMASAEPVKM